jgi:hypothetical protein
MVADVVLFALNILLHVPSPTIPSAVSPLAACHAFTAFSVAGPNEPSAARPNLDWSFFTSSPLDPTFKIITSFFNAIYQKKRYKYFLIGNKFLYLL